MIPLASISSISLVGLLGMVSWKAWRIRAGHDEAAGHHHPTFSQWFRAFAHRMENELNIRFDRVGKDVSLQTLTLLKNLFSWLRTHSYGAEQKVNQVIDTVRGKGTVKPSGPPSNFIQDIADFKKTLDNKDEPPA